MGIDLAHSELQLTKPPPLPKPNKKSNRIRRKPTGPKLVVEAQMWLSLVSTWQLHCVAQVMSTAHYRVRALQRLSNFRALLPTLRKLRAVAAMLRTESPMNCRVAEGPMNCRVAEGPMNCQLLQPAQQ